MVLYGNTEVSMYGETNHLTVVAWYEYRTVLYSVHILHVASIHKYISDRTEILN